MLKRARLGSPGPDSGSEAEEEDGRGTQREEDSPRRLDDGVGSVGLQQSLSQSQSQGDSQWDETWAGGEFAEEEHDRYADHKPELAQRVVLSKFPCEQAQGLIAALERSAGADLPPFEEGTVTDIGSEVTSLADAISTLFSSVSEEDATSPKVSTSVVIHHAAIERNKTCVLAYLWQRLFRIRQLRWELDASIPKRLCDNLSHYEGQYLMAYDELLADYTDDVLTMAGIVLPDGEDDDGLPNPLDLGRDLYGPPLSVDVEVLAMRPCQVAEEQTTTMRNLQPGVRTTVRRSIAEPLVRSGHLRVVDT